MSVKKCGGKNLAGPPVAVHARGDHRAARPVLLHVMRGAIPHGVGAGVVARVDIRRPFLPIDRHASQRTPAPTTAEIESITNLCRCGTYVRIRKAIARAAAMLPAAKVPT